jgi:TatD DNase family protein
VIDTHCHLSFDALRSQLSSVLDGAREAGVNGFITVTTTSANAGENLAIAQQHADVWCTSGVHPLYADEPIDWSVIEATLREERCVAWGELGLDHHYEKPAIGIQQRVLEVQLALIERVDATGVIKPIVIHSRESIPDLVAIFRATKIDPARLVFHCFTGGLKEARLILDLGAWISFTGVVTFKNAQPVRDAAKFAPLDRIMVETDAPFLAPEPLRKVFPNEPKFVRHVADRVAELKGLSPEVMEAALDANAQRFFGCRDNRMQKEQPHARTWG